MKKKPASPKQAAALLSRQWHSESTRAAEADPPADGSVSPSVTGGPPPPVKGVSLEVTPGILCCGVGKIISATASATGPDSSAADVTLNYPGGSKNGKGSVSHDYPVIEADCGTVLSFSASANGKQSEAKVPVIKITTQTKAEHPANRDRKTIGVAEWVVITVTPVPPAVETCEWTVTGSKQAFIDTPFRAELLAGDREGEVTVAATIKTTKEQTIIPKSITCSVAFSVIEPNQIHMVNAPGKPGEPDKPEMHLHGIPSAGFCARVYILPNTVCFKNIQVFEGFATYYGEGYWSPLNGDPHPPGEKGGVSEWTNEYPSLDNAIDTVWKGGAASWPVRAGMATIAIPWHYESTYNIGNDKIFAHVTSSVLTDDAGRTVVSKDGHAVPKELNAPTEGTPGSCG